MYEVSHREPHPDNPAGTLTESIVLRDMGGLAKGSLAGVRQKFSAAAMQTTLNMLESEVVDKTMYLGDWRNGEIEIVKLIGITANRFYIEAEYEVLFPPRAGTEKPSRGTYRNIVWVAGIDSGAVALLFTQDGQIVLTRQFRHAVRRWTLELPRGIRKPNEDLATCALREAGEETGAKRSETSEVFDLGIHDPDTGILRQAARAIAVTNVIVNSALVDRDVSESVMGPVVVPIPEFLRMIRDGEITCGWTTGAFTKALAHGLIDPKYLTL